MTHGTPARRSQAGCKRGQRRRHPSNASNDGLFLIHHRPSGNVLERSDLSHAQDRTVDAVVTGVDQGIHAMLPALEDAQCLAQHA